MSHILVLADRDWTHPEGGGSGCNLHEQALRWVASGHRVSAIVSRPPGAAAHEVLDGVEVHGLGSRSTVFARAAWRQWRGLVPDADVVLEIVNGVAFLTPLWLRTPRVVLIHHLHAGRHYTDEMGWVGRPAGALLETLPLRHLYRRARFVCVSRATQDGVVALGVPRARTTVSYNGVDLAHYGPGRRAPEPTFVVLGRLKRYKRVELVLDALAAIPGARLEIVGDGDHAAAVERAVARRGLGDRVTMHGFVDEARKRELLQRAWVNVTASGAEGWGLTIMEAAACATPSVAIAHGGPREAIVHGETGLLARDADELRDALARLAGDRELVERLGGRARERAHGFTWERAAATTLGVLEGARRAERPARVAGDTLRAAGLAAAVLANSAFALACTVLFARLLGASSYGALASLLSFFLILIVPGSAIQVAAARAISRDPGGAAEATVRSALRAAAWLTLPIAALTIAVRAPLAAALGVDLRWGAAASVLFGWLWLVLSLQRGILQGVGRYKPVGISLVVESAARLLAGLLLMAAGLGATGALLGTGLGLLAASAGLRLADHARAPAGRARDLLALMRASGAPLWALSLLALLQNLDVIVLKHRAAAPGAGAYAEAAVAARAIIWLAVGLGLFLLPEAARRARGGEDARGVLLRMIGLVTVASLPMVAAYALWGEQILRTVFHTHAQVADAGAALPVLGLAMTLLGVSYLVVQYLLALGRHRFGAVLLAATVAEAAVVAGSAPSLTATALGLLCVQAVLVAALLAAAVGPRRPIAVADPLPEAV